MAKRRNRQKVLVSVFKSKINTSFLRFLKSDSVNFMILTCTLVLLHNLCMKSDWCHDVFAKKVTKNVGALRIGVSVGHCRNECQFQWFLEVIEIENRNHDQHSKHDIRQAQIMSILCALSKGISGMNFGACLFVLCSYVWVYSLYFGI